MTYTLVTTAICVTLVVLALIFVIHQQNKRP